MRVNITQIMKAARCNEAQALNVERYINNGDMLNWSEASKRMINTIARAVNEKLLRDAPVIRTETITSYSGTEVEVRVAATPKKAVKKVSKAPVTGSTASRVMHIYKRYEGYTRQEMITYIVSEMASNFSVELTRHQAAGYYQTCKKRVQ